MHDEKTTLQMSEFAHTWQIRCRTGYFFNENGDDETLADIKCSKGWSYFQEGLWEFWIVSKTFFYQIVLEYNFLTT